MLKTISNPRQRTQKEFCMDEAMRLNCSTSKIFNLLKRGFYAGVRVIVHNSRVRIIVGQPQLTPRGGHSAQILPPPALPAPVPEPRGERRAGVHLHGSHAAWAGVPERRTTRCYLSLDKFEPTGPICGAAFEEVLVKLQAIDARRLATR